MDTCAACLILIFVCVSLFVRTKHVGRAYAYVFLSKCCPLRLPRRRLPHIEDQLLPRQRWTHFCCIFFCRMVVFCLLYSLALCWCHITRFSSAASLQLNAGFQKNRRRMLRSWAPWQSRLKATCYLSCSSFGTTHVRAGTQVCTLQNSGLEARLRT